MAKSDFDWQSKKVLVTGAGGFIGSHLTEQLVALGAQTRAFVRYTSRGTWGWLDTSPYKADVEVITGDIADRDRVRQAVEGVDVVFHLAALIGIPYSYHAPRSYVRTNIEGSLNVLQAALETGVERVVHTSTSEVYGSAQYVPIDERHPLQGQSPYSATKIGADKLVESFHLSFELPVVTVRPFNTYGPRQSARAVIPTIITQCMTRAGIVLGNLTPTRDFNYVADTAYGFICAAQSEKAIGYTVNLGTGKEISIGDLARKIAGLMNHEVTVQSETERIRPADSEVNRLCAANQLAKELLDWEPRHTLDEGLQLTIDWIGEHLEDYRPDIYSI
ncbi:MAG: SDR family NAD(P)-dependent oxidoreductase [Anaerolineae bacterium]|nr:SDR family NAD(P)-dependent oxidoreductase [Anaerolineae bacterium]